MRNILHIALGVFVFVSFMAAYSAMRLFMHASFIESASKTELSAMYKFGFIFDARIVCIVVALIVLVGYITAFLGIFGNKDKITKIENKILLCIVGFTGFLVSLSAFVNFYYFQTYHTKIDIFIFGLKDDDTLAVLEIMWRDYPIIVIMLVSAIFAAVCVFVANKILNIKLQNHKSLKTTSAIIACNILVIAALVVGIRGSISTFPLREADHHITHNISVNHIVTNPVLAFEWALKNYKNQSDFHQVDLATGTRLQTQLFDIFFEINRGGGI